MRLFIAIPVPKGLHEYCKSMQNRFPEIKKTKDFHLTIQFLGNDIEDPGQIISRLETIEQDPFKIQMGDIVPFGKESSPNGIWIECRKSAPLNKLADKVRAAMKAIGYTPDKPFRPHITLGRFKELPDQLPKKIRGKSHRFMVKTFELMRSHLEENGSRYETLAQFKMKEN